MSKEHRITEGRLTVVDPFFTDNVCSIRMTREDGFYGALGLSREKAREIGLRLLLLSGAIKGGDAGREMQLGPRH
jgi:hypothetical protein